MEANEWDEEFDGWYRHPIIHFPLWLISSFFYFDFLELVEGSEGFFALGLYICITGLWGVFSKIFFLRVPLLGKYIYENDYVVRANLILFMIGFLISLSSIALGGIVTARNLWNVLKELI